MQYLNLSPVLKSGYGAAGKYSWALCSFMALHVQSPKGQDLLRFPSLLRNNGRNCDWRPIISASEKYSLQPWPAENVGPSSVSRCGIATWGLSDWVGKKKEMWSVATYLTLGTVCLWPLMIVNRRCVDFDFNRPGEIECCILSCQWINSCLN